MKKIVLAFIVLFSPIILIAESYKSNNVVKRKSEEKKVKVTIKVNGYTLTLQGDLQIHFFQGTVTFQGTLTIQGNGLNLTLPIYYHGSGNDRVYLPDLNEEEILEFILMEEVEKLGILN